MKMIFAYPPIYAEIKERFPYVTGRAILFTWGNILYNPRRIKVSEELHVHEAVHSVCQGERVREWWRSYMGNPEFRLEQEGLAHKAEFNEYCKRHGRPKDRERALDAIAHRLASPLYGAMISVEQARRIIA